MKSHELVVIADICTKEIDDGDRIPFIDNAIKLVCPIDLVGMKTQLVAHNQSTIYNYSIEISRFFYKEQKYCYMKNKLYEIKNIGKAKSQEQMLLFVAELNDESIKKVLAEWLEKN